MADNERISKREKRRRRKEYLASSPGRSLTQEEWFEQLNRHDTLHQYALEQKKKKAEKHDAQSKQVDDDDPTGPSPDSHRVPRLVLLAREY
jgi:hypothetical protein